MDSRIKAALIFFMCLLDFFHSWWGMQKGYIVEGNALIAPVMDHPWLIPFLIKNGLTLSLLLLALYLERFNQRLVSGALSFLTGVYVVVMVMHARCLICYLEII